jgi:hypothetical protein
MGMNDFEGLNTLGFLGFCVVYALRIKKLVKNSFKMLAIVTESSVYSVFAFCVGYFTSGLASNALSKGLFLCAITSSFAGLVVFFSWRKKKNYINISH